MAPKKKGKGKGDKLARMTVEQRQQYLDRRAAQEAESNRRKEELLAGFLKLKLADEEKKGQVNEAKLMTKWREILREAKTSTLNAQLQELKTRVMETTTRQDRLIHLLSSQVAQAQHQRTQAAHNHLTATHNLTELHEEHVGMLTRHVRSREAEVTRCQAANSEDLAATHLLDLRRLSLVSQAAERHHQLTEKEELAAFHTTITHVTTQLEEELAAARVEREATLEEAWARLAVAVRDHGSQTATLRATCQQLQHRVSTNHKNLNSINQSIKDMQSEVDELRKRLRQVGTPSAAARELQHLKKGVMVLRSSLAAHRVSARTLIKAINRRGYEAKKQLEETLKEGRHVLELASICSRLEMPRDRNLPFMPPPPTIASATILDGSLRTCLVAVPPLATERDLLGHTQPQELETQVGLSTEMDEGLGTSLPSSKATLKRAMSVLETDEGVGSSVLGASTTAPAPSTTTTTSVTLPRLPSTTPHPRGVGEGRGGVRVMLGQDKLARISELLYHEEAAHEAAHTLGGHDTLGPPPDFVLQEADTVLKTHDDLRNFWRKYHHVQLERLALRSEGEVLRQEGRHLRGLLKKYFVSLGVTDAALSQSAAPVTVSHLNLSHNQQDPRHPSRRRSHSVPVGGVGCIPTVHGDSKGASKTREVVAVQEAHLLVRSAALHSLPRLRTC